MTLKEQFKKEIIAAPVMDEVIDYWVSELEQVAEEFAIGFAEWCKTIIDRVGVLEYKRKWINLSTKELLEIYKKENGL
jgi:hypothetical protein